MKELIVNAEVSELENVLAFVEEQLEAFDCPMRASTAIVVAVEEIFVNIANYAYPSKTGSATIQVTEEDDPHVVSITFIDSGIPYDPLAKPDPDTTLSAEDRQIGGLGIYMVKKSMDDVIYERKDGMNILTLKKKI